MLEMIYNVFIKTPLRLKVKEKKVPILGVPQKSLIPKKRLNCPKQYPKLCSSRT